MKDQAQPVNAMTELPTETREFLARLRPEDLETLVEGVRLVNAFRTLGRVARWVVLTAGGLLLAGVALWETIERLIVRMRG